MSDHLQEVAARRAAYTEEVHQATTAHWPEGKAIGPRSNGTYPFHVLEKMPKDLDARIAELERRIERQKEEVEKERQRYDHIRTQGQAALSAYDIGIAHPSADDAVRCALMLKTAHVSYAVSGLLKLRDELEIARETLIEERPQLALF